MLLLQDSFAASPTVGPNINLSRAAGNQYGASVAINTCGRDPLIGGKVEIKENGSVEVHVAGTLPLTSYDIVFVSLDGKTESIGPILTNAIGNARKVWLKVFAFGKIGSGNMVLQRGGADQFVSGFAVIK